MDDSLINILMRTSNRESLFMSACKRIQEQTYKNWQLIVHVDDEPSRSYVEKANVAHKIIFSPKSPREHKDHNPYNLYCNTLLNQCTDGWVWLIDDDDLIASQNTLQVISDRLVSNKINIFKVKTHLGRVVPQNRTIMYGNITTANPIIPFSMAKSVEWKPLRGGDFKWIDGLYNKYGAGSFTWHDIVIYNIGVPNNGNPPGARNVVDISPEKANEIESIRRRHH